MVFITKRPVHDGTYQIDIRKGHHCRNLKLSHVCRLCDRLKGSYCRLKAGVRPVYKAPDFHMHTRPMTIRLRQKSTLYVLGWLMAEAKLSSVSCFTCVHVFDARILDHSIHIHIFRQRVSEKHRSRLYDAFVLPVLLYNCGTWGLQNPCWRDWTDFTAGNYVTSGSVTLIV